MESKQIIKNSADIVIETVREFCDAVCSTLGPGGRTVIIANGDGDIPHVTKDGVTVSESIKYADATKQAIISLIKESARKTAIAVGDGTTTSTLLVKNMVIDGLTALNICDSTKAFLEFFDEAISDVVEYLEDTKTIINKDSDLLHSIITISSNNDQEVIELVNKAVKSAGVDGIINVETTDNLVSEVIITNGASLDTKVYTKTKSEKTDVNIVLIEGPVSDIYQIEQVLRQASVSKQPYIVIAKEFSADVQRVVDINRSRSFADITLAEAEGFSSYRLEILRDIASITGATILSIDGSTSTLVRDYSVIHNGLVEKAIIGPNELILFPFEDKITPEVEKLVKELKIAYNEVRLDANSAPGTHLKRRLSKYSSVATIKVGGATQAEVIEKKDRVDDAVCAVSAAVNGGVLPGGGMALYYAGQFMKSKVRDDMSFDAKSALSIVVNACVAPVQMLCSNAGIDWSKYADDPRFSDSETTVLDIDSLEIGDAFTLGIIDPALVAINAMINASSVTKTLIKSKVIIIPDNND